MSNSSTGKMPETGISAEGCISNDRKRLRAIRWITNRFLLLLLSVACSEKSKPYEAEINGEQVTISLEQKSDTTFALNLTINDRFVSSWAINYPIYRFDFGDITGDGIPEIAIGVIKSTRFDPKAAKRLFLFRITEDFYIRPLWLGSRVGQPLVDFRIIPSEEGNVIRTIEREQSGNCLLAEYRWRGFGLEVKRYVEREISLNKAQNNLKSNE